MGGCGSVNGVQVPNGGPIPMMHPSDRRSPSPVEAESDWLDLQFHDEKQTKIMKPDDLERNLRHPPDLNDDELIHRVLGSLFGLAVGDSLGASVEFRPREYLVENPVKDLTEGGTWGLKKGQFTDDTSMALCLASSLIACRDFSPYNQLVRYKWWYRYGYMSSTGQCFDIGAATRESLREFEGRQTAFAKKRQISEAKMDFLSDPALDDFNIYCSNDKAAGNGSLMRLCPVPLFFHRDPVKAVEYSGTSGEITHGDRRAYDACRFYGALIVAALQGEGKDDLLSPKFYERHRDWFKNKPLHKEIQQIVEGSYKEKRAGYEAGIRGKGFVVYTLEAALWAFYTDDDSFEKGALAAVNLGDDADTTAAIYGQLAGAYYRYRGLPQRWVRQIYAKKFITYLSEWIVYEGERWSSKRKPTLKRHSSPTIQKFGTPQSLSDVDLEMGIHSQDQPTKPPQKPVPTPKASPAARSPNPPAVAKPQSPAPSAKSPNPPPIVKSKTPAAAAGSRNPAPAAGSRNTPLIAKPPNPAPKGKPRK